MSKDSKLDKYGYISTWDEETYKKYYSENRKTRRNKERNYINK